MSLTTCLKKVGAALAAEDKAAVLARAGALRSEGLSATDAGRQAVDERLAEVAGQIGKVQPLVPEVLKGDKRRLPQVANLAPTAEALGEFEAEASLPDLIKAYKAAKAQERTLADAKNVDLNKLSQAVDATMAVRAPLIARLSELPALSAKNSMGLLRIVAGSAQKPGQWQLTRFDQNGEPWGDSQYSSQEAAIEDFLRDVDIETLEMGEAEPAAPAQPAPASEATPPAKPAAQPITEKPVSAFEAFKAAMRAIYDGTASVEDYKAAYQRVREADAVKAELGKLTKDELIRTFGIMARPDEKKDGLIDTAYKSMLRGFALGKEFGPRSYMMTRGGLENYERLQAEALDAIVENHTAEDLAAYAAEVKAEREEKIAKRAALVESVKDPKTLDDFRSHERLKMSEGLTPEQARMSLTPEQRALRDDLAADYSRSRRTAVKDDQRTQVRVAGQTVDGNIIATKHTKKGHDLFVVQLAERVSREDYETLNAGAKKIGGYYSSFRGSGAIAGFQFTTREQAQAFVTLAGGDATAAKEAAQERRDAYADDRSQTAAERLTEMADAMEAGADESLSRDRKANTDRRARFAAAAEASAREAKAMAKTMRNLAEALNSGKAKFLDRVRTKTQVQLLQTYVGNAKFDELRAKYPTYSEQEKHKGEPPTQETADHAVFPEFTAFRSDLASLGRQLQDVDGTKKLGDRLMKVADDVSDAFTAWAKEPGNLFRLSTFSVRAGDEVRTAIFKDRETAEKAIKRSGLTGKAIVFAEKRGVNRIIMSPSEAIARGLWTGDGDKRITLSDEFGTELVESMGRANRRGAKVSVPWQFERAYERRKQLQRMGIETPAEFRAALREFIGLREQAAEADKIKVLERAMVGRRNDGLDFFPTPEGVADEMIAAADLQPGMRVLEPSAGMGHIADQIRAAGAEPEVIEMANDRRELLEAKGFNVVGRDFLDFNDANHAERGFTFGDLMEAPDGTRGILRGQGGMGSDRVRLVSEDGRERGKFNFSELTGIERRGVGSGYDRILMNPPFSDRRDAAHVLHAYSLLKPGGRLVAIMGEGVFFGQDKKATAFREWMESLGASDEKLPSGTFMDPSLPVNTGVSARMVVIEKPEEYSSSDRARDEALRESLLPKKDEPKLSRRGSSAVNLPPAAIGGSLARVNNHPDYAEAKAGDVEASLRLARDLVTDGFTEEVRQQMGSQGGVLLPVIAQESAGRNKIPLAVAEVLAERMGVETDLEIAQATRTHRTDMDGLSRVLKSPEFYGTVKTGQRYLLVDDTLTQGGTFAALANHIRAGGGEVLGVAALSGKRYSAALSLSDEYLTQLRERFGDVEGAFRAATGYGFDGLTESEGRYLVKHDAPEQVRDRILAAGREAGFREDAGVDGPGSRDRRLSSESPRERFRRLLGVPARGIPLAQARQMARAYEDAGLRGVNVAATPADLPADLRRRLEGAADDVRGAYFPDRDQTWVFSDRVNDPDEFAFVVLHEAFHRGLGKTFGRDAKRLMGQMYQTNRRLRERADKVAAELGINRDEAIEEALADMAGEGRAQKLRGWAKLSALIRTWLGKVLDAVGLRMTFSDAQIETFVSAMASDGLRNDARVTTGAGVDRLVAASKAARQDQTETQAFKRWFGDSKVVDADGEPLVVYHGTTADFSAFDPGLAGRNFDDPDEIGMLFSSKQGEPNLMAAGDGGNVMPVYLSLQDPLVVDVPVARAKAMFGSVSATSWYDNNKAEIVAKALKGGHDGIVINSVASDGYQHATYVAFRPEQIKSAIGNNGNFDPANPDIRRSRRASTSLPAQAAAQGINIQSLRNAVMDRFREQTETPAFKRWFGDSKVVDAQGEPLVVYHGTDQAIDSFEGDAIYFTDSSETAYGYAQASGATRQKLDDIEQRIGELYNQIDDDEGDVGAAEVEVRLLEASARQMKAAMAGGKDAVIYPVFVRLANPAVVDLQGRLSGQSTTSELDRMDAEIRRAKEQGRDGVIFQRSNDSAEISASHTVYVAFRPEQIKSAIGNNGNFDPANPDIRRSRRASTSLPAQAAAQGINIQSLRNAVMDRFRDAGAKVSWWDKTLGTQFDKAKRLPAFGKVFDKVQQYLEDTSTLANEAADQAPSILPKLDSVRDVWDAAKRGLSAKDRDAIKAPIFEGTLIWTRDENGKLIRQEEAEAKADKLTSDEKSRVLLRSGKLAPGVLKMWLGLPIDQYEQNIKTSYAKHMLEPGAVFTPDELRSLYKLTDAQIKQYQEFRAAVNTSLDQVVATDALRMLGDVAELPEELHRAAVGDREGFRAALDRILDARIDAGGDEADVNQLKQLRSDLVDKYAKVDALKARGYAPLMRFGTFKVVVPGKNGEDVDFFALYETKAEANAAARSLNELPEFRGRVEQGTLSEEAYKLFAQVPLESLEMFAEAIGAEQSEVFQEYLRMAKNNRSALKRLIQRKGIAGYNEDVSRVLASFVTSNARMAAGTVNLAQAKEAAQGIREGDVRDEAIRLIDTVQNPTETAGALRGLMFVHFIGGSIASAIVNVTQPVMMTTPYLSQWGGMAKASARLLAAGRQVSSGKIADPDSAEALRRAEKDGIVSPQEIHHLTAEAMQTFGRNPVMKSLAFIWGAPFSLAEQFNRRITFLAAYQTAKAEGMADPFEFAEKAVIETQGLYNKGNASNWARNPIGAVALTFKQYSIHYLEWLRRMWNTGAPDSPERKAGRRAVWFALIMLALAGGVEGLPFMEDLNDIVDTFLQAAGIDTSAKGWKRDAIANTLGLGDEGADVFMRGFSAVGGFPLDVSIRMGMGNLLPGTGIWLRSNTDVSRDVLELAGPAGSLLSQAKDAGQKALSGDAAGAATALLPVALQNAAKGLQMLTTGEARDTKDRKIMDADEMDAAMKIIGFQPAEIARESSKIGMERKRVQLTRNVEMKIADLWAQGLRERDADMVQEARQELLEWNQANPQSRIQITNAQVLKRLKDMQATRAERFQRAAPRELRQGLAVQ